jgi:general secretion pathway protein H
MGLKQRLQRLQRLQRSRRWIRPQGFTLLEVMVVLVIMALALGAAVLALRNPAQVALAQDGQRLAAWLETGRAMARSSGQPVRWRPTAGGFELAGGPGLSPPQAWLNAGTTVVSFSTSGSAPAPVTAGAWPLVLGPEPVLPAQTLLLSLDGQYLRVASDGLSTFAPQPVP